mgnify:CR=1 FL=1|jgi:hypothetical protein
MDLPLHPMVVHLPMALAFVVPLVALSLLLAWYQSWLPARSWWVVVGLQAMLVGSALYAQNTGEIEEERVEDITGKDAIHEHEEAAELFTILAGVVLAFAVVGGALSGRSAGRWIAAAAAVGSLVVAGQGVVVGQAGGELVWVHGAGKVQLKAPAGSDATAPAAEPMPRSGG